jgi:hypothetical protein
MTPMPTDLMIELRDVFATLFDTDSLTDFALALGIDYENLSGGGKGAKARELALYLWRHSKLPDLAQVGPKRRPDIEWARILDPYLPSTDDQGAPGANPPGKLEFHDLQKLVPILAAYSMFQMPDSRNALLVISGVAPYVNLDLNGSAHYVASSLLVKLNDFGEIAPGDTAVGRLLAYVATDQALPPAHKGVIESIAAKYNLKLT